MRISDWSSDVCSSDLKLGEPRCFVRRFLPQPHKRPLQDARIGARADRQPVLEIPEAERTGSPVEGKPQLTALQNFAVMPAQYRDENLAAQLTSGRPPGAVEIGGDQNGVE